jgi:hypothetical protein
MESKWTDVLSVLTKPNLVEETVGAAAAEEAVVAAAGAAEVTTMAATVVVAAAGKHSVRMATIWWMNQSH